MINIVTRCNSDNIIRDFESFFEKFVLSKDFDDLDLDVMQKIDNAILLDRNVGSVKTRFGLTDILHLSTGCKVVLSYLYIQRNKGVFSESILDITECGSNALDILFECVDKLSDSSTVFLLRHSNNLWKCKDRYYVINGSKSKSLYEGVVLYG